MSATADPDHGNTSPEPLPADIAAADITQFSIDLDLPEECPWCGMSGNIRAIGTSSDDSYHDYALECGDCQAVWTE